MRCFGARGLWVAGVLWLGVEFVRGRGERREGVLCMYVLYDGNVMGVW